MSDDRMALIELVEKQADGDLVREMLAFAAERIMEAEIEARTGAAKGARSPMREAYVHGISTRSVDDLVKAMGAGGMSKSQVSRLCIGDR